MRPTDDKLTVYHGIAKRLEDAEFAARHDARSRAWTVSDPAIVGLATVTD